MESFLTKIYTKSKSEPKETLINASTENGLPNLEPQAFPEKFKLTQLSTLSTSNFRTTRVNNTRAMTTISTMANR